MSPHEVLGVPPDADEDAIRKAFRRQAMRWHPDRNPSPEASARFQDCVAAYEALRGRRAAPPIEPVRTTERPRYRRRRGADVTRTVRAVESARGAAFVLRFERGVRCPDCPEAWAGSSCPGCLGSGRQTILQQLGRIGLESEIRCEVCGGEGLLPPEPCGTCGETGIVTTSAREVLRLPHDGSFVHAPGAGHEGLSGGRAGDVGVGVTWSAGLDLPVAADLAARGGTQRVETPRGPVQLRVPAGVSTGQRLRLAGQAEDGSDLLVVVRVTP